jgi:hypothetical protein
MDKLGALPRLELPAREGARKKRKNPTERASDKWLRKGGSDLTDPERLPQQIPASLFKEGDLFDYLARQHTSTHALWTNGDEPLPPQQLKIGAISRFVVLPDICKAISTVVGGQPLDVVFFVEKDEAPRNFALLVYPPNACCFACALNPEGWCYRHEKNCLVPSVDVLFVGVVESEVRKVAKAASASRTNTGPKAVSSYTEFLGYLDRSHDRIAAIIGTIGESSSLNGFDVISSDLAARSFESQAVTVMNSDYGAPSGGSRLSFVAMSTSVASLAWGAEQRAPISIDEVFIKFFKNMQLARRRAPDLNQVLLLGTDAAVEKELCKRISTPRSSKPNYAKDHLKEYSARRERWGAIPVDPDDADSPWWSVVNQEERDSLLLNMKTYPNVRVFHLDGPIQLKHQHMRNPHSIP